MNELTKGQDTVIYQHKNSLITTFEIKTDFKK